MRAAVLALALAATALTGFPGPAEARSRLRYSDAYKAYLCEYHELMRRYHPAKRKESREAARERAGEREEGLTQLRERYRDAIQFPYNDSVPVALPGLRDGGIFSPQGPASKASSAALPASASLAR